MANGKKKLNKKLISLLRGLAIYALIGLAALIFFYQVSGPVPSGNEVPISQIVADVKEGKIEKITLEGDKVTADLKDGDRKVISHKEEGESMYQILEASGVDPKTVTVEVKDLSIQQAWLGVLGAILPILLMVLKAPFLRIYAIPQLS